MIPRRIIFSRKGFDSSSGGCPSPILPDGRLLSLPIPDARSTVSFGDIVHHGLSLGEAVDQLTRQRLSAASGAHIDPDLNAGALPRQSGWRPLFGQSGAAQGHLRNQGVAEGDLFVFFGLFRPVIEADGGWRFDPTEPARHVIWGWLQVGAMHAVDTLAGDQLTWARYHPHFRWQDDPVNTLYLASDALTLDDDPPVLPGAGWFERHRASLQLTDRRATRPGIWVLPRWFHPRDGQVPLTYHAKLERWQRETHRVVLQAVARGQEFVLDTAHYPEALPWIRCIIHSNAGASCR
ncbi:hypothetical protein EZI54_05755 [Marinobacter halodurans]|uniref:Nucleotide modification associated domain-containing protein n=1 Tax=Marinobacter halodurans TaxID=2528979 RepID=A0ABY1ZRZ7_9GAMM|nr:hypothetical protein [Marinobacter halodurans]TBW57956.1 hypothetical protein EZI54_05755 [Marinobacter halodurans]